MPRTPVSVCCGGFQLFPIYFFQGSLFVGYVPRLVSNASYSGFEAYASVGPVPRLEQKPHIVSAIQPGFKAFKGDGSEFLWQAKDSPPYWMSSTCPTAVRIWKVGLRGRNRTTDRLYDWRLEGSKKGDVFDKIPESDWSFPGGDTYNTDGNLDILHTSPNNPIATRVYTDNEYKEFPIDSVVKYRF